MINLDADYLSLKPFLEAETRRRKIDFRFTELNSKGWGDLMFTGLDGIHNVEVKSDGEYIGDVDHLINQIKAQAAVSDHLWLFKYGESRPAEDGNSYSLTFDSARETWTSKKGLDTGWAETYTRRYHRVNWDAQRKILWRMREVGVQVVEVRDLPQLATELCLLYESAQTEGSTFSRLIVEKIRVGEANPEKARFMRQLMGLEAGIGEELADAVAEYVGRVGVSKKIGALVDIWGDEMEERLAAQPLRNGKRTVGPAAVARLRAALGC